MYLALIRGIYMKKKTYEPPPPCFATIRRQIWYIMKTPLFRNHWQQGGGSYKFPWCNFINDFRKLSKNMFFNIFRKFFDFQIALTFFIFNIFSNFLKFWKGLDLVFRFLALRTLDFDSREIGQGYSETFETIIIVNIIVFTTFIHWWIPL